MSDIPIYSTAELLGVMQRPDDEEEGFWLRFFPRVHESTAEKIMFDDLGDKDRRLAPFVAPMAQGRVMREKGFETRSFKPAYVKPKHVVNPSKTLSRRAGEALTGEMSPAERYAAAVAFNMQQERASIERRFNWMGAKAIIDGAVTVTGDDYPTQVVDFNRDASLTDVLTGTARWGESAADPLGDIRTMRANARRLGGYPINTLIFGAEAWERFASDTDVKALLSTQSRGSTTDYRPPVLSGDRPWAYEGYIGNSAIGGGGQIDLYTFSDFYHEELDGSDVLYLDEGAVVGVGNPMGVQAFGAIMDVASLVPMRMFPKMWVNQDPSVAYTMTQSAPLMVPMNVNSTFKIQAYTVE